MDFPPENQKPIADFSASCNFLDCVFNASASYDADGDIVSSNWNFGDGNTGSGDIVPYSYAAWGSYTVYLTVVDKRGSYCDQVEDHLGHGTAAGGLQPDRDR